MTDQRVACASILVATIITAVSIISSGEGQHDSYAVLPDTLLSSSEAGAGIATIIFAFTGHLAYPQIISEMRNPDEFSKSLKMNAIVQVIMYTATACIMYGFAGESIQAPALESATGTLSKAAWVCALPTIIVAGVLPGMMIIKNANRGFWAWREQRHVPFESSCRARGSWIAIAAILWSCAPIFAEVVPSFMGVVGVAGAFLGGWISLCFPAVAWFRMDMSIPPLRRRAASDGSLLPIVEDVDCTADGRSSQAGGHWRQFWHMTGTNARDRPYQAACFATFFVLGIFLVRTRLRASTPASIIMADTLAVRIWWLRCRFRHDPYQSHSGSSDSILLRRELGQRTELTP